jgi:DNA polymerase-3 subunit alpha
MTLDIERTDRLSIFRQEAERLGTPVLPPDINRSEAEFVNGPGPDGDGVVIYYALAALKNVGRQSMDHLVSVRKEGGPFKDLADFAARIDPRQVNKRAVEGLAKAGAFDCLGVDRARVFAGADVIVQSAAQANEERAAGQSNLFADAEEAPEFRLPDVEPWSATERLTREFEIVGFYLSGHPLDEYAKSLKRCRVITHRDLTQGDGKGKSGVRLAGIVMNFSERKSAKTGRAFAVAGMSDPTGDFEVWIFSEQIGAARETMTVGAGVVLTLAADWSGDEVRLTTNAVEPIERATANAAMGLEIVVDKPDCFDGVRACLTRAGRGNVTLSLQLDETGLSQVDYKLSGGVLIDSKTRSALKSIPGVVHVEEI